MIKIPSADTLCTALAANGSMRQGVVFFDKGMCECDPEVGMAPCRYCAIHDALVATLAVAVEMEKV